MSNAGKTSIMGMTDMTHYSKEEIEILILENALDSAREHATRLKRRIYNAEVDYAEELERIKCIQESIEIRRDEYLGRTV